MDPVKPLADMLVLAGDIVDGGKPAGLVKLTALYRKLGRPIIYVPGNHEFYGRRMHEALRELWRACRANNIELLHNREIVIAGVRFFGSTLWTDYCLTRASMQKTSMSVAKRSMADHTWISVKDRAHPVGKRCFSPEDALAAHKKALRLMYCRLTPAFDGPTVVVTHHGPSPKSVHPKYGTNPVTPAFVSNLEHVMADLAPSLWVHGHTHDGFDYRVGGTRVVANPRGYPMQRHDTKGKPVYENGAFDAGFVVEV